MFVVGDGTLTFAMHFLPTQPDHYRSIGGAGITLKWLLEHGVSHYNDSRELLWAAVPWEGLLLRFSEQGYLVQVDSIAQATSPSHFRLTSHLQG